jgi:hypothetical protein
LWIIEICLSLMLKALRLARPSISLKSLFQYVACSA